MRGGEWIVPVVVLIVWLISTILKSREAEEPVRPRQPGGGGGRKPTGDIDKFLQEIDRLRRKSTEEQPAQPPRVRPVPTPVPRVKPVPRLKPAEPVVIEAAAIVAPAQIAPEYIAPIAAARAPRVAQVSGTGVRHSPGVTAALHLLRAPRTVAAALVLQEILGPPKCRRS